MENIDKLKEIFAEIFGIETDKINDDFGKDTNEMWDSVHQLNIVASIEECFDVMLEPEDIMKCTSFSKAKEILKNNDITF